MSRWVVGGLVVLALVLGGCVPLAPASPAKTVVVYGDSLVTEAYPVVAADLAKTGWQVVIRQFPGSPLCYWQAQMAADKARLHPALVILAFYGNFGNAQASQVCTQGRGDLVSVYTQDAAQAAATWTGTATLWVSPPAAVGATGENPVTPIFRNQAASAGESFVDAGATLRAADGSWPRSLPCLPSETPARGCGTDGQILVRTPAPDTVHMCPDIYNPFVVGACPSPYASGIQRWVGAITAGAQPLMIS